MAVPPLSTTTDRGTKLEGEHYSRHRHSNPRDFSVSRKKNTKTSGGDLAEHMESTGVSRNQATDAMLAWFRSEFVAANAIIDALCYHLRVIGRSDLQSEYDRVFAAIHRRRLNWIPILHSQKYFSIEEVVAALRDAAASGSPTEIENDPGREGVEEGKVGTGEAKETLSTVEEMKGVNTKATGSDNGEPLDGKDLQVEMSPSAVENDPAKVDSTVSDVHILCGCDECNRRPGRIRTIKDFIAKGPIDGHMVNVAKGLKLYDDVFVGQELSMLSDIADELRVKGQNGELSGETYISFNKELKGSRREMIQLGIPIFGQLKYNSWNVEPIPCAYESTINRLVRWHLIPQTKRPNCCIINFFDEGECSQPYLKPPHIDQPISTISLNPDCKMVFGRILTSERNGNYKGSLELSLSEGSLVVMHGNSASTTHAICPSPNRRTTITFMKIHSESNGHNRLMASPRKPLLARRMSLWQFNGLQEEDLLVGAPPELGPMSDVPKGGVTHMVPWATAGAPVWPVRVRCRRPEPPAAGTGVFIPFKGDFSDHSGRNVTGNAKENQPQDACSSESLSSITR